MISLLRRHWILATILVLLILFRAVLPYGAKYSINWFLGNKLEDYTGKISDFDLSLYRGAYQIEGLTIEKKNSGDNPPFLTISEIDLSIAWRALLHKKVMGDIIITKPVIRLADNSDEKKKQYGQNKSDWTQIAGKLVPIAIEKFEVREGEVYFRNEELKIPLLLAVKDIYINASNLTNMNLSGDKLPSTIDATADLYSAKAILKGAFNVTTPKPNMDLDFQLENFKLPSINPLMLAYGPVTFTRGTADFFSEVAAKDGQLLGYMKPVFRAVDVVAHQERFFSIKHFGLEIITATINLIFRNSKTKSVATKINIEGTVNSPKIDFDGALAFALDNAFGDPKSTKLENSVSLPH